MGGRGSGSGVNDFIDWLSGEGRGSKLTPIDIKKFQGASLQQIETRLRSLTHEEMFVIDKQGNVVSAYKGNKDSVSFKNEELYRQGATVTHGHPKGAAEFGGTFSFADMRNMLTSGWQEHRATASGQGEMNYIIRRGAKPNPQGYYRRINRDYQKLQKSISREYNKAYDKAMKSGMPRKSALHQARQKGVGILNSYYKQTAPQYGYEYITKKNPYNYGR